MMNMNGLCLRTCIYGCSFRTHTVFGTFATALRTGLLYIPSTVAVGAPLLLMLRDEAVWLMALAWLSEIIQRAPVIDRGQDRCPRYHRAAACSSLQLGYTVHTVLEYRAVRATRVCMARWKFRKPTAGKSSVILALIHHFTSIIGNCYHRRPLTEVISTQTRKEFMRSSQFVCVWVCVCVCVSITTITQSGIDYFWLNAVREQLFHTGRCKSVFD